MWQIIILIFANFLSGYLLAIAGLYLWKRSDGLEKKLSFFLNLYCFLMWPSEYYINPRFPVMPFTPQLFIADFDRKKEIYIAVMTMIGGIPKILFNLSIIACIIFVLIVGIPLFKIIKFLIDLIAKIIPKPKWVSE